MHPDDVAEFVATEAEVARQQIESRADLGVRDLAIENNTEMFIDYEVDLRHPIVLTNANGRQILGKGLRHSENRILHLECTNWNARPPLANLLLPDRSPLPPQLWPRAEDGEGIVASHRDYQRPFFCRPGTHEFHSHTQHSDEPWDRHRPTRSLDQIVIDLLDSLQHRFILGI